MLKVYSFKEQFTDFIKKRLLDEPLFEISYINESTYTELQFENLNSVRFEFYVSLSYIPGIEWIPLIDDYGEKMLSF